jgi:hypothetical protein
VKVEDISEFLLIKEKHPHLAPRFSLFWGQPDFETVIGSLLTDTRNDSRKGFDLDVVSAILNLLDQHEKQFPKFTNTQNFTDTDFRFR